MSIDARDVFTRWVAALNSLDFETIKEILHPDYVGDTPQSGERIRGFSAFRAQMENYPGGLPQNSTDPSLARLVDEDDERWAITPGFTVVPLIDPERYTTIAVTRYPDGSRWWIVTFVQMRDGKVFRTESYYAPEFEPPEWRKGIVETVPRD